MGSSPASLEIADASPVVPVEVPELTLLIEADMLAFSTGVVSLAMAAPRVPSFARPYPIVKPPLCSGTTLVLCTIVKARVFVYPSPMNGSQIAISVIVGLACAANSPTSEIAWKAGFIGTGFMLFFAIVAKWVLR